MNWQEEIARFNLTHAKVLYMIYYFYKNNELNKEEKLKLKGKLVSNQNMSYWKMKKSLKFLKNLKRIKMKTFYSKS
jgi:hypothetical protein